jgi:hypothetical protein
MPVIGFAHSSKLCEIVIQSITVSRVHAIVVDYVLNALNRFIKLPLIEAASIPLLGEIAKVVLRMIEPLPIPTRETPSFVRSVEIVMNLIDNSGN